GEDLPRKAEHFDAAGVVGLQRLLAADEMKRRPPLAAGLGEQQRAVGKVERGETDLARRLGPALLPAEAAGDHQVDDEEEVLLEPENDAFAEPPDRLDGFADGGVERRIERAHQKWVDDSDALERLAEDPRRETRPVRFEIRKFGHGL